MGTWIAGGIALVVVAALTYAARHAVRPSFISGVFASSLGGVILGGFIGMFLSGQLSPTAGMSVPSFWPFIYGFWGAVAGFAGSLLGRALAARRARSEQPGATQPDERATDV